MRLAKRKNDKLRGQIVMQEDGLCTVKVAPSADAFPGFQTKDAMPAIGTKRITLAQGAISAFAQRGLKAG